MKKMAAQILAFTILLCLLSGCAKAADSSAEITVFAAASMTETLTKLGNRYMENHENVTVQFNFDSSGTLKTQIQEGADCDIFISAGQKQMDQLDIRASRKRNEEGLDYVLADSRCDLLENKVALVAAEGNPADLHSYDDLKAALDSGTILLAMGNEDVPVGQYTQKIFSFYGMDEDALAAAGCITYGSNVKEVASQVAEAAVECGIIYQTDAVVSGLTIIETATPEMCGQVIYPAAVLNSSQNKEAALDFLDYLKSDDADAVFADAGFTPVD